MTYQPQHHQCFWGRRRLTEISLADVVLGGAGVGVGTFLFALADLQRTWHAEELDSDNAVYLSLSGEAAEQGVEPTRPLLPNVLREQLGITERALSEALRQKLALDLAPERPMVGRRDLAEHIIELHDDCFFHFESKDPSGVEKVLGGILAQHGGHLGHAGLPAFAPDLLCLLRSRGVLRLRSLPALARVNVFGRAQAGLLRWLRPWTLIGAIVQIDSAWRFVPSDG